MRHGSKPPRCIVKTTLFFVVQMRKRKAMLLGICGNLIIAPKEEGPDFDKQASYRSEQQPSTTPRLCE